MKAHSGDDRPAACFRDYVRVRFNAVPYDPALDANPATDPILQLSLRSMAVFQGLAADARRPSAERFNAHLAFVDHDHANAFASYCGGIHLCGITTGLVTQLISLSRATVAQPGFFAEADAGGARDPAVVADQRHILAEDLAHLLLRFCWLHELYHGLNGHIGLLQQMDADATLFEMPEAGAGLVRHDDARDTLSPSDRHAMEYDADRTAFWAMFRIADSGIENVPTIAARPLFTQHRLALFAAIAMIELFGRVAQSLISAGGTGTHPPRSLRLHNFIRTLASHLALDAERTHLLLLATLAEVKAVASVLASLPDMDRLVSDLGASALQKPFDKAEHSLMQLRQKLYPFAFR